MNPETEFRDGLEKLAEHYHDILGLLGEDPEREGLQKTPMRVAKAMQILTRGYSQDPHKVLTDARSIYSQRTYHRTEQNCQGGRHLQPQATGAGTAHTADKRLHTGDPQTAGSNGCHRGKAHVHADEGRGETERHHDNKRLQRCFQQPQYPTGIHESP